MSGGQANLGTQAGYWPSSLSTNSLSRESYQIQKRYQVHPRHDHLGDLAREKCARIFEGKISPVKDVVAAIRRAIDHWLLAAFSSYRKVEGLRLGADAEMFDLILHELGDHFVRMHLG